MKKRFLFLLPVVFVAAAFGQVSIKYPTITATKSLVVPSFTSLPGITPQGSICYLNVSDTATKGFYGYNGIFWIKLSGGSGGAGGGGAVPTLNQVLDAGNASALSITAGSASFSALNVQGQANFASGNITLFANGFISTQGAISSTQFLRSPVIQAYNTNNNTLGLRYTQNSVGNQDVYFPKENGNDSAAYKSWVRSYLASNLPSGSKWTDTSFGSGSIVRYKPTYVESNFSVANGLLDVNPVNNFGGGIRMEDYRPNGNHLYFYMTPGGNSFSIAGEKNNGTIFQQGAVYVTGEESRLSTAGNSHQNQISLQSNGINMYHTVASGAYTGFKSNGVTTSLDYELSSQNIFNTIKIGASDINMYVPGRIFLSSPKAVQLPVGSTAARNGTTYTAGAFRWNSDSTELERFNGVAWHKLLTSASVSGGGSVGPQGPAGPAGPQGATGPQGPPGSGGTDTLNGLIDAEIGSHLRQLSTNVDNYSDTSYFNGRMVRKTIGDSLNQRFSNLPPQFNPIAGSNVTLSGTYPNITFNATGGGGGSSQWSNGANGAIYYNSGNVGIQTTNPVGKFQVDLNNDDYTNTGGAGSHIMLNNPNATGQNVISSIINGNLVAKMRTDYVGNINWVAGATGAHYFFTGGDYPNGTAKMFINNAGDMGINTLAPLAKLHVVGNMKLDGNFVSDINASPFPASPAYMKAAGFISNNAGTQSAFGQYDWGMYGGTNNYLNLVSFGLTRATISAVGNFGIDNQDPQFKLDVNGTANVNGALSVATQEHADNAAALAAGLAVGTIYRTGDLLKIVH